MNALPRYRVALIGCGEIAETGHLPSLTAHPRFELAALCDTRIERARLLAGQAGRLPYSTDYRELLARKDIDAVVLALHPETSVDVAIDCLRSGKAVLDEKPLATTLADGQRLAREVEALRGVYQIGFVFRYCRQVLELGAVAREIGTPAVYRVRIADERLDRTNIAHFQRIQQILRASSAITHEGSHVLDYLSCWNASPPVRVKATATRSEPDFCGPNLWNAEISLEDGSVLHLEIAWFLPNLPPSSICITGPRGCLQIDPTTGRGERTFGGKQETFATEALKQAWSRQLDAFAEAIDLGEARTATVYDGLRALAATQACERSAKESAAVEIERVCAAARVPE